jgi:hypothetical protein
MFGGAGEFDDWRALFVLLNEQGVVTKTQFVCLSSGRSLDEQLEQWAAKAGATRPPAGRN